MILNTDIIIYDVASHPRRHDPTDDVLCGLIFAMKLEISLDYTSKTIQIISKIILKQTSRIISYTHTHKI